MIGQLSRALRRGERWAYKRLSLRQQKRQWESQVFAHLNERPIEYAFLFAAICKTSPRTILDVGTGKTALPALLRTCGPVVTAIDNVVEYWPRGMFNPHYHILDQDIRETEESNLYDLVSCISVLEHIAEHARAVVAMYRLLNPGGYLALTFPYSEGRYIPNVYELPGAGYGRNFTYIGQVFSRKEVELWVQETGAVVSDQEYWRCFTGEYWTFGERLIPPVRVSSDGEHQLSCVLLRKPGGADVT